MTIARRCHAGITAFRDAFKGYFYSLKAKRLGNVKLGSKNRLTELDAIFVFLVGNFAIFDNHLHLRVDPRDAVTWSDEKIIRRSFRLYPAKVTHLRPLKTVRFRRLKEQRLLDRRWLDDTRKRLTSLRWLIKNLKQPLSRLVNPHGTAGTDGGRNNGFGVWKAFEGAGHDRRRSSWSAPRILVN